MRAVVSSIFALAILLSGIPPLLWAAPCATPDPERRETGVNECLVYRLYRSAVIQSNPNLVIVLHGDVSSGGPANYHRKIAESIARDSRAGNLVVAALVRPGYEDADGGKSSGSHNNRSDHYTAENIDEVAAVVGKLRDRFQAISVALLGHSGGAALSGVIIGRHPILAGGAVLVSCPCNVPAWRAARRARPWSRSESPHWWVDKVGVKTQVIALTGSRDDNTAPALGQDYVQALVKRGIKARFELIADADHEPAFRSARVIDAVFEVLSAN
jgi:pimeloyl-ACP methyl ester carboxylesterase